MQVSSWRRAFTLTIPILLGYIPLAIAYAVMWTQSGLPALWALAASVFVYAGAMQFLLVGLLASGVSPGAVALATLIALATVSDRNVLAVAIAILLVCLCLVPPVRK